MNNVQFTVDDNGHSHHKMAYLIDGQIQTLKIPSAVGDGASPITTTEGVPQSTYRVNGRDFCCSDQRHSVIDVRNEGYQCSDENKALVAHALHKAGLQGNPIALGVTLPWREVYLKTGKMNVERMDSVARHFQQGEMTNLCNQQGYDIRTCKTYPEGLSAFFDWAIDEHGSIERATNVSGPVAVVDIGGSTTDITTVVRDEELGIDHARSNTKRIGVLDAKDQVIAALSGAIYQSTGTNPEVDGGLPLWMVNTAFTTGLCTIGQHTIDLSSEVSAAKRATASQLLSFIKTTIGNPLLYQAVIFVGGGAIVFKEA